MKNKNEPKDVPVIRTKAEAQAMIHRTVYSSDVKNDESDERTKRYHPPQRWTTTLVCSGLPVYVHRHCLWVGLPGCYGYKLFNTVNIW